MKMQFVVLFAVAVVALSAGAVPAEHQPGHMAGAPGASGSVHADVKMHQACPHCGMDREKFAHSRMLITYSDGSSAGVCSIHCAVTELKASKGKTVKMVEVADLNSRKLVDVEKATWVVGGSKKGVMTRTPKWAFETKNDSAAFIKKYGGTVLTYKETLSLAEKD